MEKEKLQEILEKQLNEKYYSAKELKYGTKPGVFLSALEYKEFLEYKENIASLNNKYVTLIPLPTFNSKCLYYSLGNDLKSLLENYDSIINEDLTNIFHDDFINSRIYSEIEGTLNVENVPTTRRRLKELLEDNAPIKNKNDIIIKNLKAGIDFVEDLPEFNKENLFKLYTLLSKDSLEKENELLPNNYYRHDTVEISRYHGCPYEKIDENMNIFFDYVNKSLKNKSSTNLILLPHICHYYILYIHPYFDYNGRTARMVSYWIYLLSGQNNFPPIISEAINQTKIDYYKAIEETRDAHNDLTYFFKYLLSISIDYVICYQDLIYIEQVAKNNGYVLTSTDLNYIKRILISYNGTFCYLDFLKMINVDMTKQGALKILNKYIDCGFLKVVDTKTKFKMFDIKHENIPYALKNYGYQINN